MGLWPGTQRTWEKEEAKGRNWIFLLSAAPAWGYWGGGGVCSFWAALVATDPGRNCVHLPGAGMPGHQSCRTAAREGEGRHSQGPGSAGRDVEIQTEGSLLPSALLTLFEIEL